MSLDRAFQPTPILDYQTQSFCEDPFPHYDRIRALGEVVWDPALESWFITTHKACIEVLSNSELFTANSAARRDAPPWSLGAGGNVLRSEGSGQRRLRGLVSKVMTPRAAERMRAVAKEAARDVLTPLARTGKMQLAEEFSPQIPVRVLAEVLGMPMSYREPFFEFAHAIIPVALNPFATAEEVAASAEPIGRGFAMVREFIAERRNDPGDDLMTDLISAEEDGDRLSMDELLTLVSAMIIGGTETTIASLSLSVRRLLLEPESRRMLEADPSLWPSAVDEMLRYEWISLYMSRYAVRDCEFFGRKIRKGDTMLALLHCANVDPAQHADPKRFDIRRKQKPSLSFGHGAHYCMGSNLAKIELHEAMSALFALPNLDLSGEIEFDPFRGRMVVSMPVVCTPDPDWK